MKLRMEWMAVVVVAALVLFADRLQGAVGGVVTTGPTVAGTTDPNSLTNNDTRNPTIASKLTINSGVGDAISFGNNSGQSFYSFLSSMIYQSANGHIFADATGAQFGNVGGTISGGVAGTTVLGGPAYNYGSVNLPYLIGGLERMTNFMVGRESTDRFYPAPILAFNSFYEMSVNPNGAWVTNTIGVITNKAWQSYGWTNLWLDDGVLTNRVSGHLTASATAFPQGVGVVVAYATNNGFNIGCYLTHAPVGCSPTTMGTDDTNVFTDVTDMSALGFSMLKVDNCGVGSYHGERYAEDNVDYYMRHCTLFSFANLMQETQFGRRPMLMETTEQSGGAVLNGQFRWFFPMMNTYNMCENGSPLGGNAFGGNLTNFVTEQGNFWSVRPGHTFRLSAPVTSVDGTAKMKEFMSFSVLAPASVIIPTNVTANNSVYFTNPIVNGILLSGAAFTEPGIEVNSNAATGISIFSRPLGPVSGTVRATKPFVGYDMHGGAYSNLVLIENLSAGAQTATVTWGQLGIPSNTWVSVTELWGSDGKTPTVMSNSFNTYQEQLSAGDCKLYSFNTFSVGAAVPEYTSYLATNIVMNSATLSNVNFNSTMLLQSGKKYRFTATLFVTESVATEGAKIDFNAGTATATDFRAHAELLHDTGGTTNLTAATSTTLSGALNIATTATVNQHVFKVEGSIEPSATGTFGPRFCQNTHSTGQITLFRGSNLIVTECP